LQYVNKYSAAFWGTSFVKEMVKLNPESEQKKLAEAAA
jgi:trehalose 6-phosphate synthase